SIANFAGTSTKSSVTLTWDTTQYATSGAVVWGTSLTSMNNQVSDTVTGTHHSVTITGLAADTIYFFQALASDNRGQNKSSDVIQVRTMAD
ncbi:fibronectin type III domain-containing protein, partial [Vibrio parahaemolyticus]